MESQNGYIENEILLRVSQGDETAFRILFQHWHQRLASYVFRITESKEQTEEIVQDVFLKIWMTRETLSEIKSFQYYLLIISRNKAFDEMKKLLRRQKNHKLWEKELKGKEENEEEKELKNQTASVIDAAIDRLPSRRREVYLLSRHQRLTYQEIAEKLGISRESVKTHLKLATESISKFITANMIKILIAIVSTLKKF